MGTTGGQEVRDDRHGTSLSIADQVTVSSVRLFRPREAPQGAFRDFEADIEGPAKDGEPPPVIGRISGGVSWLAWLPELVDDGLQIVGFAELIAAALDTGDQQSAERGSEIDAVLMIEQIWLKPEWRGNRLCRRIAEQLIDLLLFTPESTLVLARLVPEPNLGSPSDSGVEPCAATRPHHDLHGPADFEQWRHSNTWWLRPSGPIGRPTSSACGPVDD